MSSPWPAACAHQLQLVAFVIDCGVCVTGLVLLAGCGQQRRGGETSLCRVLGCGWLQSMRRQPSRVLPGNRATLCPRPPHRHCVATWTHTPLPVPPCLPCTDVLCNPFRSTRAGILRQSLKCGCADVCPRPQRACVPVPVCPCLCARACA